MIRLLSDRSPSGSSNYHNGRIDITSPEQFVPLYLAALYETGDTGINEYYIQGGEFNILGTNYNALGSVREGSTKEKLLLRQAVKNILKTPVVKSYTLENIGPSTGIINVWDTFCGARNPYDLIRTSSSYYVGLGMFGYIKPLRGTSTLQSSLYPSITFGIQGVENYVPLIQIVVKAKHLAYIRAKLYTKQAYSLPHSDIMLLKAAELQHNGAYHDLTKPLQKGLKEFVNKEDLKVMYMDSSEISKYLYKPRKKKTAEQTIKDAIHVFNNQDEFLAFA